MDPETQFECPLLCAIFFFPGRRVKRKLSKPRNARLRPTRFDHIWDIVCTKGQPKMIPESDGASYSFIRPAWRIQGQVERCCHGSTRRKNAGQTPHGEVIIIINVWEVQKHNNQMKELSYFRLLSGLESSHDVYMYSPTSFDFQVGTKHQVVPDNLPIGGCSSLVVGFLGKRISKGEGFGRDEGDMVFYMTSSAVARLYVKSNIAYKQWKKTCGQGSVSMSSK